ncbi:MAG: alpha-2-macroglobulin family protein [Alphaproteobacteria bacterium]|nr:alpha-2-macroglobulin family protein [Alphaproteobacteria bacterium]
MLAPVRAGVFAALVTLAPIFASSSPAHAADKAFTRPELADAGIRLEAQIKKDAGSVGKPLAQLRREADAAFQRNDVRGGMVLTGQIVAVAPQEAANWLRLARAVRGLKPANDRERSVLLERAAAAAYLAYQRAGNRGEEAESLVILGQTFGDRRIWRPALDALRLSLELREEADVRVLYERMRETHGFRLLDYSVDADAASPRACFQFSEELPGKRTDFSPFVAVAGMDRPALSSEERQLCVEGLKHGERYSVTLRAGLPSTVKETLAKSVEMSVYVRDRKPFARFSSRAYVLPRTGQRGIPVISVNTNSVNVAIYRVGDRSLLDTVLGRDFQRTLSRYEINRLADTRAAKVWSGELTVEQQLNAEVTTAFPVDRAVGDMAPGVYLITADAKGADPDDYSAIASQWFVVSDLGIAAYSGSDGINVSVHSLASTEPKGQVEVRLMSRGNEVLSAKRTDAQGRVQFEAGLARGEGAMAPAMLVASEARGDYGFLNLRAPAFDLTDRGVSGRPAPAGLDAFVYTERGVYRSGETVHITALLRDPQGAAAANVPLTLVVERPDGLEYRRVTVPDQGLGGRSLSVAINSAATTGTWRVRAHADPKRPAIGEATFLVEDYVPDRLEFELAAPSGRIARNAPAELTVDGRYLYGAPASELNLEGELVVAPANERPNFAGYRFGIADEEVTTERQPLSDLPETDEQGKARFEVKLDKVPETTRPLEATVIVRMAEPGGRAVERKVTLPVTPTANMIGVRPMFSGRSLGEGETANFDVVMASPDGKTLAASGLRYELLKVEQRYQWYRRGGNWGYEPIKLTRRIADGRVDVAADKPGRIALPVQWGRYRLDVSTGEPNSAVTSVAFDAGWYTEASADTPDMLEVALDKPEYRAGEAMTVAITARTAGRVTLNVMGEKLLHTVTQDVQPGTARIRLNVGRDWGTGAYVVATLRRPLDQRAQRMPGRAIGVQWFAIDRKAHTLAVGMTLPNLQRPNSSLRVPIKIGGLTSGEDARIVVAAVDVGILNLTNYKPPAPDEHYLGQKRLGTELRDLYGQLIDGMQGTVGQIRTGGDGPGSEMASPPSQKPLALYSGIVTVKSDGTAEVNFDIPAFAGTVRVMAVAWSRDKVGRASGDVTVRDPVVLTATLPRFLLTGDRSSMHLDLDNVEGAAGEYRVQVRSGGIVALGQGASRALTLRAKQRGSTTVPLTASGVGTADLTVQVTGPGGFTLERSYALAVKPSTQVLTRRTVRNLARNEALTLSNDLFADLVPGTGSVAVSVGPSTALDAATLLRALDRYPFGCSEQIVSRALPLLYVNDLAAEAHLALDSAVDQRIRDAIERVLARQTSNGSFGLWGLGGGDAWLDAYVADFLTRAKERKFPIPEQAFKLALERLRNVVATAPEPAKDGGRNLAYALYVLARNGVAPLGDLRYLADAKLGDLATPIAKAQVAAALGLLGDRTRAERVYRAALADIAPQDGPELFSRIDYGSTLRDAAALVTLAAETGGPRPALATAVQRIEQVRAKASYTSTQENAWLVLAARALAKDGGGVSLNVAGTAHRGALYRTVRAAALGQPLRIANAGEAPVQAVVSVSGAPTVPEPAAENGFKIERQFYSLDGEESDPAKAKQNQRFVVVLKVTETEPQYGRVLIADYLPAGFEIDNPRLVSSGDTGTLSWISDAAEPEHSEFRDDRFTAAFNRNSRSPVSFSVAYVVRAVAPGRYVLPQAYVEDMYRPDRFGRTETGTVEVTAK